MGIVGTHTDYRDIVNRTVRTLLVKEPEFNEKIGGCPYPDRRCETWADSSVTQKEP